jgi:hypothetical protein
MLTVTVGAAMLTVKGANVHGSVTLVPNDGRAAVKNRTPQRCLVLKKSFLRIPFSVAVSRITNLRSK